LDLVGFLSFLFYNGICNDADFVRILLRWIPTTIIIIFLLIPSSKSSTRVPIIALEQSALALAAESGQSTPAAEWAVAFAASDADEKSKSK